MYFMFVRKSLNIRADIMNCGHKRKQSFFYIKRREYLSSIAIMNVCVQCFFFFYFFTYWPQCVLFIFIIFGLELVVIYSTCILIKTGKDYYTEKSLLFPWTFI